jgi:Bacteriophage HK97-gp10, putative tail-component
MVRYNSPDMEFRIQVPQLDVLVEKLIQYPDIAAPILQRAMTASQAVLAKNTNRSTVPWRTGFLVQSFQWAQQNLTGYWYPTASYARFVEFGTAPHTILPKEKKALWWPGAMHPVRQVNHPGTKPNKYMERIMDASESEIQDVFGQALDKIVAQIA